MLLLAHTYMGMGVGVRLQFEADFSGWAAKDALQLNICHHKIHVNTLHFP